MTVELMADLEKRLLNVWPAVSTEMIDGWAVRFANGYSSRANSASAIEPGAQMTPSFLEHIIALYHQAGLPAKLRITPVAHATTRNLLAERGFTIISRADTLTCSLHSPFERSATVNLPQTYDDGWLNRLSSLQSGEKSNPDHLRAIVSRLQVLATFATVYHASEAAGFGLCAIDRGWAELGSIIVDEKHRGRGCGRALLSSLLHWAQNNASQNAFLQVEADNIIAINLYRSFGFVRLYSYETWALPLG